MGKTALEKNKEHPDNEKKRMMLDLRVGKLGEDCRVARDVSVVP